MVLNALFHAVSMEWVGFYSRSYPGLGVREIFLITHCLGPWRGGSVFKPLAVHLSSSLQNPFQVRHSLMYNHLSVAHTCTFKPENHKREASSTIFEKVLKQALIKYCPGWWTLAWTILEFPGKVKESAFAEASKGKLGLHICHLIQSGLSRDHHIIAS